VSRHDWLRFAVRRSAALVLVLFVLVFATFMLVQLLPGDPALAVAGPTATPAAVEQIRHELGLDKSFGAQFTSYLDGLAHGNLGTSFQSDDSVTSIIRTRLPVTIDLIVVALPLILVFGIGFGLLAGARTRDGTAHVAELAFTSSTTVIAAMPEFLLATFLAYLFAVRLRWLPVAGSTGFKTVILPALAISIGPIAILARIVRIQTLDVLGTDYMRSARSKRLPTRILYMRHALPNVLTGALTVGGLVFINLVGGAVIVENVFARNGLGTALVTSVLERDYPVVRGTILVLGVMVVIVSAAVDATLAVVDPRSLAKDV
jgi:peptide/nickel transport system permease protein